MAAAVPFALKAGAMIGGSLLGKKLSGPSNEQKAATAGTQQSAAQLAGMAPPLMKTGQEMTQAGGQTLGAAGDYYKNILSNRQSARESLAPEMQGALEFYKGAEGKAKRTMRGGSRDYAVAELDRQKVGQMAGMLPAARAMAAQGAGNVGGQQVGAGSAASGQGINAASNAAYVNSGLFNQASQIRGQEQEGGKNWGNLLYDVAGMIPWGKKGGGGGGGSLYGPTGYGSAGE